jgi:ribosomal protein S18 acetylase RimI-like enzyme
MSKREAETIVRTFREADIDPIKAIDRALIGPNRASSWPLRVEAQLLRNPSLSLVAEKDGEVVGFLLGDIRGIEYGALVGGWVDMMGVSPGHQGQGIGRKLVEAFCERCRSNGVGVRVVAREDDESLIPFWTALGFRKGNLVAYER